MRSVFGHASFRSAAVGTWLIALAACGARTPLPFGASGDDATGDDGGARFDDAGNRIDDGGARFDDAGHCVSGCNGEAGQPAIRPLVVSGGFAHTCAITNTAGLMCWGTNAHGELGAESFDSFSSVPLAVVGRGVGAKGVAASFGHTCAITANRGVACWGHNYFGELGTGDTTDRAAPGAVLGVDSVAAVATGQYHSCAIRTDGAAYCWGINRDGELGDGTSVNSAHPVAVASPALASISAGDQFTCGVTTTGKVLCWGDNSGSQLGDGTSSSKLEPIVVTGVSDAATIASGADHSCALTRDGDVYCWGGNRYGPLGNGTTVGNPRATKVQKVPAPARQIATSLRHTCAILSDDTVACWGSNSFGQLGIGSLAQSFSPVRTMPIGEIPVSISAGEGHVCVVTSSEHVFCWGWDELGQLGDGKTTNESLPVRVVGL